MSQDVGAYMLDVNASKAVLQQEQDGLLRVIGYASKAFTGAEKLYCITRKELAAMVFRLKHYRQYLLGRKFIIRTDHAALSYLMTAKDLIGQQARWVDLMSEFDFTIQHRAGCPTPTRTRSAGKYHVSSMISTVASATNTYGTPSTYRTDPGANAYGSRSPERARWYTAMLTTPYGHSPHGHEPRLV